MNNKFKHTLTAQGIILRQDGDESTWLETNGGTYVPLVRIRDTVLTVTDVVSLRLEIGQSFLPQLTVTFNDDDFHYRETDFSDGLDVVTIFIGAPGDEVNEPIKNDYIIRTIDASPGSDFVTLECELHVPELYNGSNAVFTDTSLNVLETIASTCGLGFTTNIQATDDSMNWIQYTNNIDFIHTVTSHSYIDGEASVRIFVDQFANLTVVNLSTVQSETANHLLEINPTSAEQLETPIPLVLTSNKLDTDNPAKITSYTPTSNYGQASTRLVTTLNNSVLNFTDYTSVNETIGIERNVQQDTSSMFTSLLSENTHPNFNVAPALHLNNLQSIQGTQLRLNIDWAIQSLFMMQVIPVEVFNVSKKTYQESVDPNVNLDELTNQEPATPSSTVIKNENLSGNCLILEMAFSYYKSSSSGTESRLKQSLRTFKIN